MTLGKMCGCQLHFVADGSSLETRYCIAELKTLAMHTSIKNLPKIMLDSSSKSRTTIRSLSHSSSQANSTIACSWLTIDFSSCPLENCLNESVLKKIIQL